MVRMRVMRSRGRGVAMLVAGCAFAAAVIVIAFVPWGRSETLTTQQVGHAAEITATPLATSVRAQDGADRLLQRERTGYPCGATLTMGCSLLTPIRMVPVFVIRDYAGAIRAFVGEDPRNGCKLVWRTDVSPPATGGAFYDPCHGSIYDRNGRVMGGPSPWNLNEWAIEVRDDIVFVDPAKIIPGGAPGFARP